MAVFIGLTPYSVERSRSAMEPPGLAIGFGDHVTTSSQGGRPARDAPQPGVTWPVVSGTVPQLALGHIDRPETAPDLLRALVPSETVLLADGDDGLTRTLGGLGGTGKTQLAVAAAQALRDARAIDLLVWVPAGSRAAIITSYAHACGQVGVAVVGLDAESAARQLLEWLANTSRPWLVVLDGLADPPDLDGLWPRGTAGRTLVTTRRLDASLLRGGRRIARVGVFTRREAMEYLRAELEHHQQHEALDLADDLGYLPLGLGQAAAVMVSERLDCREYRVRLSERKAELAGRVADGYSAIAASWRLALDSADQFPPPGMARPALALTALLGSAGIPGAVLTSKAACAFVVGHANVSRSDDESQVRHSLHNLASLGLVTIDGNASARTIEIHSLVRAAVLDSLSAEELGLAVMAAAGSLLEVWPEQDQSEPLLAQALRDSARSLQSVSGGLLWDSEAHPLLMRAGESLDAARLIGPAVGYWRAIAQTSADALGPGHLHTLQARDKLASALVAAGDFDDAIEVLKGTLAQRERVYGPGHQDSLASRLSLAAAYKAAGRLVDAIPLYEKSVAEQAWLSGPAHPDTWTSQASLASAYQAAGRAIDAIPLYERAVAEADRLHEPDHPDILAARRGLADAYQVAGRVKEAIRAHERIVADAERSGGPNHPDTLAAWASLAAALLQAGRGKDAIRILKRNLVNRERILGPSHSETLATAASMADAYLLAGQVKEAIALHERTLAQRERVAGPSDPNTVASRASLASAYHTAGRLADAIPLYRRAIADSELLYGASHSATITLRGNLAHAYHTVGRPTDAVTLLERTLTDCERFLGLDHPLTQTMRENHAAITGD